uniref:Uncharacterized protein n=1 Tax=Poecilia formosa TaxID=48698 RepID=A0A096LX19_POEFO
AIMEKKKKLADCIEIITQAEVQVSAVEDEHSEELVQSLKGMNKMLEDKVIDMETTSWLHNLRLAGLPEGAEGQEPCSFLEQCILEAFEVAPLQSPIVMEGVHWGPKRGGGAPPRALIMKFLNYKEAAKTKKDILYKKIQVQFYNDLATEVHKQRRGYVAVRQQVQKMGRKHGIIHLAKLLTTQGSNAYTCTTPWMCKTFINK